MLKSFKKNQNNILIIKHGSFGDLIRSCVFIEAIKKFHKNDNVILLTSKIYESIIKKNPNINGVEIDDRKSIFHVKYYLRLRKKLLSYKFKYIYDLQNSQRTLFYKKILLPKHKWLTTNREKHPISGLRGLADMLKKNKVSNLKTLISDLSWLTKDVNKILIKENINKKYILLIPGSSKNNKGKRWPYYDDLISLLLKKKFEVVTILGPEELDLENKLPGKILKNLSWEEVSGVIQKSIFVIANDTGPVHIAACLRKPGLIFFGPTSPERTELNLKNFISVRSNNLHEIRPEKVYKKFLKRKLA